ELERPRVGWLLVEVPVRLRHRVGPHQPAGREVGERCVPRALPDPLADPGGVYARIDDEVGDGDVLRTELPGRARRERPQAELRAGEGRVPDAPAEAGGGTGEEDASALARQHEAGCLSAGEKARVARHLPDLAEHALGGVDEGEVDVGPDVEDADL